MIVKQEIHNEKASQGPLTPVYAAVACDSDSQD